MHVTLSCSRSLLLVDLGHLPELCIMLAAPFLQSCSTSAAYKQQNFKGPEHRFALCTPYLKERRTVGLHCTTRTNICSRTHACSSKQARHQPRTAPLTSHHQLITPLAQCTPYLKERRTVGLHCTTPNASTGCDILQPCWRIHDLHKHGEEVRFFLGVCRPESSASNPFELYSVTIRKPLGLVLVDAPTGSARSVMVESVIGTFPAVTGVPLWK